jgi:hypothetical protein
MKKNTPCSRTGKINIVTNIIQSNLQIQHNTYQNHNGIFCTNEKIHPKILRESQGTLNSWDNSDKEKHKLEDPHFLTSKQLQEQGMVIHACNPSTWEAETRW